MIQSPMILRIISSFNNLYYSLDHSSLPQSLLAVRYEYPLVYHSST